MLSTEFIHHHPPRRKKNCAFTSVHLVAAVAAATAAIQAREHDKSRKAEKCLAHHYCRQSFIALNVFRTQGALEVMMENLFSASFAADDQTRQ